MIMLANGVTKKQIMIMMRCDGVAKDEGVCAMNVST